MTANDNDNLKTEIRDYFKANMGKDARFADGDDIFADGLVNSLFALQLVTFLEDSFNITVENDDLDLQNFRSVDAIADFVGRKRNKSAA